MAATPCTASRCWWDDVAFRMDRMAGLLWIAPAIAQTAFTPRDESPEEFAAGTGRDETFYACTACHGFKLVAQQGMTRAQWEDSINLMVRRHNMPPLDDKDRDDGAELSRGGLSAARAGGPGRLGEPVCQVSFGDLLSSAAAVQPGLRARPDYAAVAAT